MIYRKPQLHDLTEAASKVNPIITLPMATCAYFGLGLIAHAPPPGHSTAAQAGDAISFVLVRLAATLGMYVLPLVLVLSAILWMNRFIKIRRLKSMAAEAANTGTVANLDPTEFEDVVAAGMATNGFVVQRTREGADGGIDLIVDLDDKRYLVQCKHYQSGQIGVDPMRAFFGVMKDYRYGPEHGLEAAGGYFITSGKFTQEAQAFAAGKPIFLYNGTKLQELLVRGRDAASAGGKLIIDRADTRNSTTPACPICRSPTILRVAKQGRRTGQRFYGCETFPKCSGKINVD